MRATLILLPGRGARGRPSWSQVMEGGGAPRGAWQGRSTEEPTATSRSDGRARNSASRSGGPGGIQVTL